MTLINNEVIGLKQKFMNLITLKKFETNDLNSFITFWSNLYSFSNEKVYSDTIFKNEFSANDIQRL